MTGGVVFSLYGLRLVQPQRRILDIAGEVAREGGLSVAELRSARVTRALTRARRDLMVRAVSGGRSQSAVARFLNRHPSTVSDGLRRAAQEQP